jgi:hypothetical protein
MPKYEDYYYRRPGTARSFVKIGPRTAQKSADRAATIMQGPRYFRVTLALSQRTKRMLGANQIAQVRTEMESSPLELKPNFFGFGLDLVKTYHWIMQRLRRRK